MDAIGTLQAQNSATATPRAQGFGDLTGEDFFKLLISQIVNQDPLEPTGNQELLEQISSIREIELSTAMTDSLKGLTGQQQYAAASSLIGRFVTGPTSEDGAQISGPVIGARFEPDGQAILQLATGEELPLETVTSVATAEELGASLVGKTVTGVDLRDPANARTVQGLVTAVRTDERGDLLLEIDTGESLRLADVTTIGHAAAQPPSVVENLAGKASDAVKRIFSGLLG
jgi:flagellar basal-body rod modification protein FlgD